MMYCMSDGLKQTQSSVYATSIFGMKQAVQSRIVTLVPHIIVTHQERLVAAPKAMRV